MKGPFGHTLKYAYDSFGFISTITVPGGEIYKYAVNGIYRNGLLLFATAPDQTQTTYIYDNASFPAAITDKKVFGKDSNLGTRGTLSHFTYTYDSSGRLTASESDGGVDRMAIAYDDAKGSTAVTDANGNSHTYTFQTQFDAIKTATLSGVPCPQCGGKAFSYDDNGFIASRTDFNGNITNYTHNARGLETSRTEGSGSASSRTISTSWDSILHLPLQITEPNRVTTFSYDANGNLVHRNVNTTGLSSTWGYTYNTFGQVLTVDGPRTDVSDITRYAYNATDGTLLSITNALGHNNRFTAYDGNSRPLTLVDPNGLVTTFAYDERGRRKSTNVGGIVTSYTYDGLGHLMCLKRPDTGSLGYSYDAAGRLKKVVDDCISGFFGSIAYTYDPQGNLLKEEVTAGDPLSMTIGGRTHSYVYDQQNRVKQSIGALNQTTDFIYDNNGNLTQMVDPLNQVTDWDYDALDRPKAMTDANGAITQAAYNKDDRLASLSDARGNVTRHAYDGLGNLTTVVSPDTGSTRMIYDGAGNLLSRPDANGWQVNYSYDALNRVTQIRYSGIAPTNFVYDQGTNGIGRLTRMTDSSGSTAWTYDQLGHVTQRIQEVGAMPLAVRYAYDSTTGQLASITYPSGRVVKLNYLFEKIAGLSVNAPISNGLLIPVSSIAVNAYQPFGLPLSWGDSIHYTNSRTADEDGRLNAYTLGDRLRTINYDAASRISAYTDSNAAFSQGFGYDGVGRLTQFIGGSTIESYGYDSVGNRVSFSAGSSNAISYAYSPASNLLLDFTNGAQQVFKYKYDPLGNVTYDAFNQYTYDGQNRLTQAQVGQQLYAYWRNDLGQRVAKSLGKPFDLAGDANHDNRLDSSDLRLVAQMTQGQIAVNLSADCNHDVQVTLSDVACVQNKIATLRANPSLYTAPPNTYFVYDEAGHLIGEYDTNGQPIQETAWLGDTPVTVVKPNPTKVTKTDVFNIYTDHLNAPRVIVNQQGAVVWSWESNPFGTGQPVSNTGFVYNLRFPGQYFDNETGLVHNGFRDYNPQTGRYIQSDPIGLAGGVNSFSYVMANPINAFDIFGLASGSIDFYRGGIGGGVTLGKDSKTGAYFASVRFGVGSLSASGLSLDPLGERPGNAPPCNDKGQKSLGGIVPSVFAKMEANGLGLNYGLFNFKAGYDKAAYQRSSPLSPSYEARKYMKPIELEKPAFAPDNLYEWYKLKKYDPKFNLSSGIELTYYLETSESCQYREGSDMSSDMALALSRLEERSGKQ